MHFNIFTGTVNEFSSEEGLGRLEAKLASKIRELEKQNQYLQKKLRYLVLHNKKNIGSHLCVNHLNL